jgi:hypothetical protein
MDEYPVTQQPGNNFGFTSNKGTFEGPPGLSALAHLTEVKVKQKRPGCLECKLYAEISFKKSLVCHMSSIEANKYSWSYFEQ